MEWLLEKVMLYPRRSAAVGAVVLVLLGTFTWWQAVWQDPTRVFEDMLANNLRATSVTKLVHAGTDQQGVDQIVRLQMGSTSAADWLVTAKQSGVRVTTDSIGTPTTGYIRYTEIADTRHSAQYAKLLNIWAKSDGKTDSSLNGLFSQTLLDISSAPNLPIGNLPQDQRENLLNFIRVEKVFTPDYSKVKDEHLDDRSVITYPVAVNLSAYVRLMQAFAHDLGQKTLDQIDPNQYTGFAPVTLTVSIDRFSHQLIRASYKNSGFVQDYTDWGLASDISLPVRTITTTDLQHRLQAIKP